MANYNRSGMFMLTFPAGTAQYHINGDIAIFISILFSQQEDIDFIKDIWQKLFLKLPEYGLK